MGRDWRIHRDEIGAVMSVNRGETRDCAIVRQAMIAIWIGDATENREIKSGIGPIGIGAAGITTVMRRDLGAA